MGDCGRRNGNFRPSWATQQASKPKQNDIKKPAQGGLTGVGTAMDLEPGEEGGVRGRCYDTLEDMALKRVSSLDLCKCGKHFPGLPGPEDGIGCSPEPCSRMPSSPEPQAHDSSIRDLAKGGGWEGGQ